MWYGLGVDLGTTFSSAALAGPSGVRTVFLPPDVVVPSVAYLTPEGKLETGPAAARGDDPKRMAGGFKRRLGDPTPFILGGRPYSAATLMAAQLRDILAEVTRIQGRPPATVVLSHPAVWGPYRVEQFTEVPRLAGLTDFHLSTEPECAATHYCQERRLGDGEIIAVYDLGGGTFDTTILRMRNNGMEILGTPEGIEHMGGIDFDETLLAEIDARVAGAISQLDGHDPEQTALLARIRALTTNAKERLSIEPDVTMTVPLPGMSPEVSISRLEFNEMIRPSITLTIDALRRTIASAGLAPENISAIMLAGGSSRIPLVAQLISQEFGKPVRLAMHPKHTVSLGAARLSTRLLSSLAAESAPVNVASRGAQLPPPRVPPPNNPVPPLPDRIDTGSRRERPAWLLPTIAAAVAVVIAAALAIWLLPNGEDKTPAVLANGSSSEQVEQVFTAGSISPPWGGYVGSPEKHWAGVPFDSVGATSDSISAELKQNRLTVTWSGEGQVYMQSGYPQDLSHFFDTGPSALVFTVTMHKRPQDTVTVQIQCDYPCHAKVEVTELFKRMPIGQQNTVAVPMKCFSENPGEIWKPAEVDTPWLLYSKDEFAATFTEIFWTSDSSELEPVGCDQLH